jgi:hypothetical protein
LNSPVVDDMALAPYDILDRLASLTGRPVRARHVPFDVADAAYRARFVDARDEWVATAWADLQAVLRFSAASAMLPLDAALHSLATDAYLLDDFHELMAGCASAFELDGVRLAEFSEQVPAPAGLCDSLAMEVWLPGYGCGRVGFGMVGRRSSQFRRSPSATTVRRHALGTG